MQRNEHQLSDSLRLFIRQYITSLEQLEILLLLNKDPDRAWTIDQVFKVTQTNVGSVAGRLRSLAAAGFLSVEDSSNSAFRYNPTSPELAQRITELNQGYAISKTRVIEAIFSAPPGPEQYFAESFKLKRRE